MNSAILTISYSSIAPEIITAITGVVIMLVDAFSRAGARRANALVSLVGLSATVVALFALWSGVWVQPGNSYFGGMVAVDGMRIVFSLIVVIVAIVSVLLASSFLKNEGLPPGEFFALLMFATCGMLMMVSAADLVMVFLGLETTSISTYILAGVPAK
jgi:NADH-quinone oxidoreductase subunit N